MRIHQNKEPIDKKGLLDHYQKIFSDARQERRTLGMMRLQTFFLTLGLPAGLHATFFKDSAFISNLSTGVSFAFFGFLGMKLNKMFQKEMATQTRIARMAEDQSAKLLRTRDVFTIMPERVTYQSMYNEASRLIKREGIKNDVPTKAINLSILFSMALITVNFAIRTPSEAIPYQAIKNFFNRTAINSPTVSQPGEALKMKEDPVLAP